MSGSQTVTPTFAYKSLLADGWTTDANVDVVRVRKACAPESSRCEFRLRYGYIYEAGPSGSGGGVVSPMDYRGMWVRVLLTEGSDVEYWYGYCPEEDAAVGKKGTPSPLASAGTDVYTGDAGFVAYGYEYFLKQHTVGSSYVEQDGVPGVVDRVLRAIPFNAKRSARGAAITGNMGSTAIAGTTAYPFSRTESNVWTAREAIDHLFYVFSEDYGIPFKLTGQYYWLDSMQEPWPSPEGKSFYQVLLDLIKPSRGFTFLVHGTSVHVVSISDSDIGSPVAVPANPNVASLSLDTSEILGEPRIQHLDNVHFDKILVEGEPLRVGFTMSIGRGTLEADWTAAEQAAYDLLDDDERRDESTRHVYCRYRVPPTWDGTDPIGTVLVPRINTATGYPDWTQAQTMYLPAAVLERSIPIYSGAGSEPGPPRVWFEADDGDFYRLENPDNDSYKGCPVRVLGDRPGFSAKPRIPHYLGMDVFAGTVPSETEAVVDYREIVATVSMYTDERVRVEVDAQETEPGEVEKVKRIAIPGAHCWVLAPGTCLSWKGGAWETVVLGGLTIRDDVPILQNVAKMARAWYGRRRATVSCTYKEMALLDRLGHVIQEVTAAGTTVPAGTVITRIDYDFDELTTTFASEWKDIDLGAILRPKDGMTSAVRRRVGKVEEQLANVPALVGGGGGVALGWAKITAVGSAGPPRLYTADVYARRYKLVAGSYVAETAKMAEAVELIAPQLDDTDVLPVGAELLSRKADGDHWEAEGGVMF